MAKQLKTIATHPKSKREIKIDSAIYEPFKSAIILSLKNCKGKTFTDLTGDVRATIRKKLPAFDKSIPWYTISILRDLETRGLVENYVEKGVKFNRLKQ